MLKGNLSTRPFYNDRLVTLIVAIAGLLGLALAAYDVSRLYTLLSRRHTLQASVASDRTETERVQTGTAALQQRVDRGTLAALAGSTREANDLIDQRTFSWTAFFGLIEKTLPLDVRVVSVSPRVEKGVFRVVMVVIARRLEDVNELTESLLATGAFYDVSPTEQQRRDDGTYSASIEAAYLPATRVRPAPAASSSGAAPASGTTPLPAARPQPVAPPNAPPERAR
jgi:hypothetical protein